MIIHLVDGTYELFRHFYGLRRFTQGEDRPFGAVIGVLQTVLQMIETGATHIGVATDHVIESFRNRMWPGYKTGDGIEPALLVQFHPLEEALAAMGVAVWPMIELEADDALASAAMLPAQTRQEEVAKRGAKVMPFDLEQTTHLFQKLDNGGLQKVVVKDPSNKTQIALIQSHLKDESEKFRCPDANFLHAFIFRGDLRRPIHKPNAAAGKTERFGTRT